jgi:hypothetical protein
LSNPPDEGLPPLYTDKWLQAKGKSAIACFQLFLQQLANPLHQVSTDNPSTSLTCSSRDTKVNENFFLNYWVDHKCRLAYPTVIRSILAVG